MGNRDTRLCLFVHSNRRLVFLTVCFGAGSSFMVHIPFCFYLDRLRGGRVRFYFCAGVRLFILLNRCLVFRRCAIFRLWERKIRRKKQKNRKEREMVRVPSRFGSQPLVCYNGNKFDKDDIRGGSCQFVWWEFVFAMSARQGKTGWPMPCRAKTKGANRL